MLNQSHAVAGTATPAWGILRLADVKALTGIRSHATIYAHVKAGLFPDSIPLGLRAVGWPADEVQTVTAARVAGAADDELRALVQQLHAARRAAAMRQTEYLPTYHALHDRIHTLAAGSPNERFIHMNINRVVNKAVGLQAGQRPSAPLPQQALLVVAQHVATQALQQADDHRDGYQVAKDAVLNLSRALLLGGAA